MKWSVTVFMMFVALATAVSAQASDSCLQTFADIAPIRPNTTIEDEAFRRNQIRHEQWLQTRQPGIAFRVVTWNINLLKFSFGLGPLNLLSFKTSNYTERSRQMQSWLSKYLQSEAAPDTLLLQEVWTSEDQRMIFDLALASDYVPVFGDLSRNRHFGLQILVKRSAMAQISAVDIVNFDENPAQRLLFERLGRVDRGLMYTILTLPSGLRVLIGNLHLTPFVSHTSRRESQINALAEILRRQAGDADVALIGGDFNIAADFLAQTPSETGRFEDSRYLYEHMALLTGAVDTFRAVHPPSLPGYTFNPAFSELTASAPHQRIDYVWVKELTPRGRVWVSGAENLFQSKINSAGEPDEAGLFPSDHFAYQTDLQLF